MDPLVLRFLERLTVVVIGGMAIYLGYRLFLKVPEHRDSAGKLVLPWDISIVMTRVGPGVFFALFGVIAVGLSLIRPLEINAQSSASSPDKETLSSVRYAASQQADDRAARVDARALLRKDMAVLNTIHTQLRMDLATHDRDSIARTIREVKLALLRPVWGDADEGFGDFIEFERWIRAGEPRPPPAGIETAVNLYHYGQQATGP